MCVGVAILVENISLFHFNDMDTDRRRLLVVKEDPSTDRTYENYIYRVLRPDGTFSGRYINNRFKVLKSL